MTTKQELRFLYLNLTTPQHLSMLLDIEEIGGIL